MLRGWPRVLTQMLRWPYDCDATAVRLPFDARKSQGSRAAVNRSRNHCAMTDVHRVCLQGGHRVDRWHCHCFSVVKNRRKINGVTLNYVSSLQKISPSLGKMLYSRIWLMYGRKASVLSPKVKSYKTTRFCAEKYFKAGAFGSSEGSALCSAVVKPLSKMWSSPCLTEIC